MANTAKDELQYASDVAQLSQQNTYIPSANVAGAQAELQQVNAGKPAEYTSENAEQLGGLYDKIINRDAFSYDPSKDSAFQDYKMKYMAAGQQAAKDAIRTNRSMAGGYGDVWTKAAANQQYGEYMKGVNDVLPQFEQNAYGKYQAEGNLLNAQLGAAQTKDNTDYARWQDQYNNWANDRNFAANRLQNEYQKDYRMYSDNTQNVLTMIGYGREDAMRNAQWEREDALTQQQWAREDSLQNDQWAREDALRDQQWGREDTLRNQQWAREDQEIVRNNAYNMSIALLQQGVMPIDTLLNQAGINRKDALKFATKNGYVDPSKSSGHSGSKKRGSGSGAGAGTLLQQPTKGGWKVAGTKKEFDFGDAIGAN